VNPQLGALSERSLFTVAGETYTWGDALVAAELRGGLAGLERQTRLGIACLRRLAAEEEGPAPDEVRAAATRFRHERNLLSAEELEGWLAHHGLSIGDWTGYLRRALLRERWSGELERIKAEFTVADEEVEAALPADAVCTGFLRRAAEQLAADAALAAAGGSVDRTGDRRELLAALAEAAEAHLAGVATAARIEREVGARNLDWMRVEADSLELADAEAAREAALCVRLDGRPLAEVAADSGAPMQQVVLYVEDAEPELRPLLLSARPGELVGPLERGGGRLLLHVRAKTGASADDPELRRRAADALAARAVARELRDRVRWHERF
jgi:hypothetical protein